MIATDPRRVSLAHAAREAGAKDLERVVSCCELAISRGDTIADTLDSLKRNQPDLFGKPPRKFRESKPSRESTSQSRREEKRRRNPWDD